MKKTELLDSRAMSKIKSSKIEFVSKTLANLFESASKEAHALNAKDMKITETWCDEKDSQAEYVPFLIIGIKRTPFGKKISKNRKGGDIKKLSITSKN